MIQKYVGENVLLIPNVIYKDKDNYTFDWTIDKKIYLTGHTAIYSFDTAGKHKIQLVVTDVRTTETSTYINIINVIQAEQAFSYDLGFGFEDFGEDYFGV